MTGGLTWLALEVVVGAALEYHWHRGAVPMDELVAAVVKFSATVVRFSGATVRFSAEAFCNKQETASSYQ